MPSTTSWRAEIDRDYVCWDHAGLSHDEIASLFGMPSSNSVGLTILRTKTQHAQTLKVLKHQISHK